MNRLLIYFFFDKQGVIDPYVNYILAKLRPFMSKIILVSNGTITKGNEHIDLVVDKVIERENVGFDVWAYKTALDSEGWSELEKYDEVILMNYTIMGPVYSMEKVFATMDKRKDLDFWGITKCFREENPVTQEIWGCPYGYVPEHIQSSFMVFRNRLVSSEMFQNYWDGMPPIHSYYESGGKHEQYITKYFHDNGFEWDCYTDYSELNEKEFNSCPLIVAPMEVVKKLKSPFFKRRSFFTRRDEYSWTNPEMGDFFEFLDKETDFDVNLLIPNLIRTCNQSDLCDNMLITRIE